MFESSLSNKNAQVIPLGNQILTSQEWDTKAWALLSSNLQVKYQCVIFYNLQKKKIKYYLFFLRLPWRRASYFS